MKQTTTPTKTQQQAAQTIANILKTLNAQYTLDYAFLHNGTGNYDISITGGIDKTKPYGFIRRDNSNKQYLVYIPVKANGESSLCYRQGAYATIDAAYKSIAEYNHDNQMLQLAQQLEHCESQL